MLRHCRCTLLLLSCIAVIGEPRTIAAEVPSADQLQQLGLETKWQGQAVLDVSRDEVRYVTSDEDVIVVQSTAGVVSVFNAEDGRRRWAAQAGRNDEPSQPAVTSDRYVLVVAGPVIYGYDKFTGDQVIEHRLPHLPGAGSGVGTIARDDVRYDYLYVPLSEGSVYAYELRTLLHLNRYGTLPPQVARPFLWRFICKEPIAEPPVFAEESVLVATKSRSLHILNPEGKSLYQLMLNESATTPMATVRDSESSSVLLATGNNLLYDIKLERPAGTRTVSEVSWTLPMDRTVTERPVPVGNHVFVTTTGGGLHDIDRDTGRPVQLPGEGGRTADWYVAGMAGVVAVSKDRVYAVDVTNRLVAIDRATADAGNPDHWVSVDSFEHRFRNAVTDRIYLISSAGEVVCLREQGSEFATYHQNPEKEPIAVEVTEPAPNADAAAEE
ncbi:MAG: PQQ-binding-like beta-propeller repeat protein [Planctomycetaceae bacterium]